MRHESFNGNEWRIVKPEIIPYLKRSGYPCRTKEPPEEKIMVETTPWQIEKTPTKHNRNHWSVCQGSAELGAFWIANGTIYAYTTNQPGDSLAERLLGNDIGWMETSKAAQWVFDTYHQLKKSEG